MTRCATEVELEAQLQAARKVAELIKKIDVADAEIDQEDSDYVVLFTQNWERLTALTDDFLKMLEEKSS